MGVPRLFKYIKTLAPQTIRYINAKNAEKRHFDHVGIDSNNILHSVCQKVFGYGNSDTPIPETRGANTEQIYDMIADLYIKEIDMLTSLCVPIKSLYIAVDGPAPLAKQMQQRQRRFVSQSNGVFETSNITPGTEFMWGVHQRVHSILMKKTIGCHIMYSPFTMAGEGEHKIMDYIRQTPLTESFCMIGPDADLIMLTLSLEHNTVYLLKENTFHQGFYHLFHASAFKQVAFGFRIGERLRIDRTLDFIFMGMFVGNDFLPKLRMFFHLEDGFELMRKKQKSLTISNGDIVSESVLQLLNTLKNHEIGFLEEQAELIPFDEKFENRTLLRSMNDKSLDFDLYRKNYYEKCGITKNMDQHIARMCIEFIKGLYWVYYYYVRGIPCWNWKYNNIYAPLAHDLYDTYARLKDHAWNTFVIHEPSPPFLQLCCVLPPSHHHLLPPSLRHVGTIVSDVFPKYFHVDYEGVSKEYQGVAHLPPISFSKMKMVYEKECNEKYDKKNSLIPGPIIYS